MLFDIPRVTVWPASLLRRLPHMLLVAYSFVLLEGAIRGRDPQCWDSFCSCHDRWKMLLFYNLPYCSWLAYGTTG